MIAFSSERYRRRSEDDVTPHITHNQRLEIIWSVIPLLAVMSLLLGLPRLHECYGGARECDRDSGDGKKWLWQFEYPDGMRTLNEFHVPVNRPVRLVMTRGRDPQLLCPDFRVKQDIVPGRYTETGSARPSGSHQVFCAEYCGKGHSDMLAKITSTTSRVSEVAGRRRRAMKTNALAGSGKCVMRKSGCADLPLARRTPGRARAGRAFGARRRCMNGRHTGDGGRGLHPRVDDGAAERKMVKGYEPIMPTFQGLLRDMRFWA